jgi:hypothetical protein
MPEEILKINLFSSKRIPCGGEKLKSPHWWLSQAAAADRQTENNNKAKRLKIKTNNRLTCDI